MNNGSMIVGGGGTGSLNVLSGSNVTNSGNTIVGDGNTGQVSVSGANSQLNVSQSSFLGVGGGSALGTLNISGGGTVNAGLVVTGNSAGSNITLDGTGGGATLNTTAGLVVNGSGIGLIVRNGGTVMSSCVGCSSGIIGFSANQPGTALVTGVGSTWTNTSQLDVGLNGTGVLTIQNGGTVNSFVDASIGLPAAVIGYSAGSAGIVSVSGTGSTWNITGTGMLNVGLGGTGSLTISSGGQVNTTVTDVGGSAAGASGSVFVNSGGTLNAGTLDIGTSLGIGMVTAQNGGTLTASSIEVGSNGTLTLDPTTQNVNGNFTLDSGGVLTLDISGTDPSDVSQLDVSGLGVFDGIIDLNFIGGFAPQSGQEFDIVNDINGVNVSGATIQYSGLVSGYQFATSSSNGELVATAITDDTAIAPEPSSFMLFGGALCALGLVSRVFQRFSKSR